MTFWIRHLFLIVCCVILPFVAALYLDTQAEIERTREAGARAAEVAIGGLDAHLQLQTTREVEGTRQVGASIVQAGDLAQLFLAPPASPVFARVERTLGESVPPEGFGLVVDPQGYVIASAGPASPFSKGSSLLGHPVFTRTQLGFALDVLWSEADDVFLLTAAPLVQAGVAAGAVIRARKLDQGFLGAIGRSLDAELSLLDGSDVAITTLSGENAAQLRAELGDRDRPSDRGAWSFGKLRTPISASNAPFLPLFIDHAGTGLGYSALIERIPGSELSWAVAVRSGEGLAELGERQAMVFATMLASIMLAILIGLINARTFVGPLATIESHLSEIQMGRGDVELPEVRVSKPYRRLVRLINMTVQKLPARGLAGLAGSSALDRGDVSTVDLRARTAVTETPSAPRGAPALGAHAPAGGPAPLGSPGGSGPLFPSDDVTESESDPDLFESDFGPPAPAPAPDTGFAAPSVVPRPLAPRPAAPPPTAPPPTAPYAPPRPAQPDFTEQIERQLNAAIDSIQEPEPTPDPSPPPAAVPPKRSAAEIRGRPPRYGSGEDVFGDPQTPAGRPESVDLGTTGLPRSPFAPPPPTVVAPVADDLLARGPDHFREFLFGAL